MRLVKAFSKIMFVRNRLDYFRMLGTIIIIYVMISIIGIYTDGMFAIHKSSDYSELRYIYIGTYTVLIIAGITGIIQQFYTLMLSGLRDYKVLKSLGATNYQIRILNLIQGVFLIIVSIPIGLTCGYFLTLLLKTYMKNLVRYTTLTENITSLSTMMLLAGFMGFIIISMGIYLDMNINKLMESKFPWSNTSDCEENTDGNM